MSKSTKVLYNGDCPVCSFEIEDNIHGEEDKHEEIDLAPYLALKAPKS